MFDVGLDTATKLAAVVCPRCKAFGLTEVREEEYRQAKREDIQAQPTICPSVYVKCPACNLVGEWPGIDWGDDPD